TYERTKGCNYHICSEHLITFRSSAAAYYDMDLDGGTGHFGGFKFGCTSNGIAADGLLNAPDYTRTCSCSYQNQTSIAMIHMPDVEVWTTFPETAVDGRILRLGVNLGAPGDRRAENDTLWLEYPATAGTSPDVRIQLGAEMPGTVSRGAVWKYLDDGSDQGTAWRMPEFDDSAWPSGRAELGYGDGDEATTVSYGPDKEKKFITTYFRRSFDVPELPECDALTLNVKRDDGAVVYLNGVEVYRAGMPEGAVDYLTLSTGGETWEDAEIDAGQLVQGTNLLAVEIHQSSPGSSDISFDLEMEPAVEGPEWILHHSSFMEGDGPRWVGASGASGLQDLTIALNPGGEREFPYTVRLYFAELQDLAPGQRIFSASLQGRQVLDAFDIAKAAGGPRRTVMREFTGVMVKDELAIRLTSDPGAAVQAPLLCGVEVIAEPAG
ncbi:MAG: hypothetical protein JXR94_22555, partial [Candidatus Hydrogenedentes bacterium]|nr:hypothetical protein [Candidatus Hydrogenedentota bacterium]